jgi:hypothetical protein
MKKAFLLLLIAAIGAFVLWKVLAAEVEADAAG